MGACSSLCAVEGAVDHWIYVKTGDKKGAGTDANISIILYDNKEQKTSEIPLSCPFNNDFERGQRDVFQAPPLDNFGDIEQIEIWRDASGFGNDWFCEIIMVVNRRQEKSYYFPVQKWLKAGQHYIIRYDF